MDGALKLAYFRLSKGICFRKCSSQRHQFMCVCACLDQAQSTKGICEYGTFLRELIFLLGELVTTCRIHHVLAPWPSKQSCIGEGPLVG